MRNILRNNKIADIRFEWKTKICDKQIVIDLDCVLGRMENITFTYFQSAIEHELYVKSANVTLHDSQSERSVNERGTTRDSFLFNVNSSEAKLRTTYAISRVSRSYYRPRLPFNYHDVTQFYFFLVVTCNCNSLLDRLAFYSLIDEKQVNEYLQVWRVDNRERGGGGFKNSTRGDRNVSERDTVLRSLVSLAQFKRIGLFKSTSSCLCDLDTYRCIVLSSLKLTRRLVLNLSNKQYESLFLLKKKKKKLKIRIIPRSFYNVATSSVLRHHWSKDFNLDFFLITCSAQLYLGRFLRCFDSQQTYFLTWNLFRN